MIVQGELSAESQARSRKNLNIFSFFNGFSYMCLGDTVIILFAVRLGLPDYSIAVLGSMVYLGYLLLPLGRMVTARVGAAQSQASFWVMRNLAALIVASAAVFAAVFGRDAAMPVLLIGAFLFYGFRAAGVVMSQPLNGDITDNSNRAGFIATNIGLFNIAALLALVLISDILRLQDSMWVLMVIIVCGSMTGIFSSRFVRRVEETTRTRDSARAPLRGEIRRLIRFRAFRAQVTAALIINVSSIMTFPMSTLMLKRGFGVSDTDALIFSMVQLATAFITSRFSGRLADLVGPRRVVIGAYLVLSSVCFIWFFAPPEYSFFYMAAPFVMAGAVGVTIGNSMTHYFLQAIPVRHRVAASILSAVITGVAAGALGSGIVSGLLKIAFSVNGAGEPLAGYRLYFLLAGLLIIGGIVLVSRMKVLSEEPELKLFRLFPR